MDPTGITDSVIAGIVQHHTQAAIEGALNDGSPSLKQLVEKSVVLLEELVKVSSPLDNPDLPETVQLGNVPTWYYEIPNWKRNHLCMLIPSAVTINYQVMGMPVIAKTISNGGWYQLDLPQYTQIWASVTTNVLIRWCDLPIGASF